MIPSSLSWRWMNMKMMSYSWSGRSVCFGKVSLDGRDPICIHRRGHAFTSSNVGGKDSLLSGNRQCCRERRSLASCVKVYMSQNFKKAEAKYNLNGSAIPEGVRFVNTNVTVNLTQHIVHLDGKEGISDPGQAGSTVTTTNELGATIEASLAGDLGENLISVSFPDTQAEVGKWWHIPDSITDVLPLPADFEERLEVLFRSFGTQIDSRELLLRVLVHKSYYDQRVPAAIKNREYRKPRAAFFIDSGEVKEQYVEGLPLRSISCMTLGDAHGEVRSQLAILGDAVIGLAVSSLLVRQHSSAGTITERKCQMVSNNNISQVWRTLLGPQDFVLSFGDSSSQPSAPSRMMADSCEAYIGALYTEKGFGIAFECVNRALLPLLVQADSVRNPVHALNVHSSAAFQVLPEYRLVGIDNQKTQHQVCRVRVYVKGYRMATGMGINQKLARVDAARKALEKWPEVFKV